MPKTHCIFARVRSMYIDPTKLHFTTTYFSQNILVNTSTAKLSPIHTIHTWVMWLFLCKNYTARNGVSCSCVYNVQMLVVDTGSWIRKIVR